MLIVAERYTCQDQLKAKMYFVGLRFFLYLVASAIKTFSCFKNTFLSVFIAPASIIKNMKNIWRKKISQR